MLLEKEKQNLKNFPQFAPKAQQCSPARAFALAA
jgi:hypothetical protein